MKKKTITIILYVIIILGYFFVLYDENLTHKIISKIFRAAFVIMLSHIVYNQYKNQRNK